VNTRRERVHARCYIVSSQSTPWKVVSTAFAKVLCKQRVVGSAKARSLSLEGAGRGSCRICRLGVCNEEWGKRLGGRTTKEGVVEFLEGGG
jgi:hypothetical protein